MCHFCTGTTCSTITKAHLHDSTFTFVPARIHERGFGEKVEYSIPQQSKGLQAQNIPFGPRPYSKQQTVFLLS